MDPRQRAPFCDVCKAMLESIADPSKWILGEYVGAEYQTVIDGGMIGPHQKSTKGLLMSAAWGCGICAQLKEQLSRMEFPREYSQTNGHPWLRYDFNFMRGIAALAITDWSDASTLARFELKPLELEQMRDQNVMPCLSSDKTSDEEVFERARSWLSDCMSHRHSCDKHAQPDYYPPRLLQIDEDRVRLIETKGIKISGRYATLSYCWGRNPRHLTLTTQNIDTFREGLKASNLAKTFREAIHVAQSLGIYLLWIDALCILQSGEGHVEDWQKHLVEMAVIYVNCILNIAVDHGESAEAGCFVSRDPETIRPCVFEVPPVCRGSTNELPEQKEPCLSGAYLLSRTSFWHDLISKAPLVGRGWIHQERLLSPRILHFGRTQLVWECTELLACETFPVGLGDAPRRIQIPFSFHGGNSDQWHKVIEAYSSASLTNPQDKLPAVAGIAKRLSIERGAKYGAGMFLSDLPESLLWSYEGGPLGGLVTPYRAPSWSWASREGEVYFHRTMDKTNRGALACIDDVFLEYTDDSNPFGQVKGGLLRIAAPMLRISWMDGGNEQRILMKRFELVPLDSSSSLQGGFQFRGYVYFDASTLVQPRSETRCLFIAYTDESLQGLILEPFEKSAQPQRWMRIGVFYVPLISKGDDREWVADTMHRLRMYPKTAIELV